MIPNAFSTKPETVLQKLRCDATQGLNTPEVKKRLQHYGYNKIPEKGPKKKLRILADQFVDPIIYILLVAFLLAVVLGDWAEGIAILVVIAITVGIGYFMEFQAVRALEKLRSLGRVRTRVLRDGVIKTVGASVLVPGDILILQAGDIVAADARLLRVEGLQVKEAALTGESLNIEKTTEPLPQDTLLPERENMVYKGTFVVNGTGRAVVVATGMQTELGKIQVLSEEAEKSQTPIEQKLAELSRWLIGLTLLLAILVVISGIYSGMDLKLMIQTGVALAVAAIPEGLPIVATIALARGMLLLSKKQVIIKKLEAVHTLGATDIICTDKTGTLTEDRLKVHTLSFADKQLFRVNEHYEALSKLTSERADLKKLVITGVLCNESPTAKGERIGDSIDIALLELAENLGLDPEQIRKDYPDVMIFPFDTNRKYMLTVNRTNHDRYVVCAKGAFEVLISYCNTVIANGNVVELNKKQEWNQLVENMAAEGYRTLALAYRNLETPPERKRVLEDLTLIGVIGFIDPARTDVRDTISLYKNAGIKVVMMTGDHPRTAGKIAQEIGMLSEDKISDELVNTAELDQYGKGDADFDKRVLAARVFARVTPKQKLDLIKTYQEHGHIVGMFGDGVNDVPALRKADIGVAMGIRGTEVAREAADVILKNDKFTAMELAIHQGRLIFEHIRQFVVYLLSCNLAEIISVGVAAILALPAPLLPLQILYLNLITDVFPALALGMGKGEKDLMNQPPRKPEEPIMTPRLWITTAICGLSITIAVLGITLYSHFQLNLPVEVINNMAFYTLVLAQLLNIFNMPSRKTSFLVNEVTQNPWVWGALILCVIIVVITNLIPVVAETLSLVPLTLGQWAIIGVFGLGSLVLTQLIKRLGGTV